jgi:hypothetical protein
MVNFLHACMPVLCVYVKKGAAYIILKTRPARGKTAPGHCIKKKTFSHRSRKPPNLCPAHTQRHRSPCENDHDRG